MDRALCRLDQGGAAVLAEALAVLEDDIRRSQALGERGAHWLSEVVGQPVNVQTHCNAGALACVEWGTALGVVRALHEHGALGHVYASRDPSAAAGRPAHCLGAGSDGGAHTLVIDSAAASIMASGLVDAVIVGADRITANGDVINKIGTYPLALAAARHGIPMVVAAPESTVDLATADRRPGGDRDTRDGGDRQLGWDADRPAGHQDTQLRLRRDPGRSGHRDRDRAAGHPSRPRRAPRPSQWHDRRTGMENRWNSAEAPPPMTCWPTACTARGCSGSEPELVLHGGGNTSVKTTVTDITGEPVEVLYVKGSGWNLATIEPAGFAPLRLNRLRDLLALAELSATRT